jgi:glutaredoxin-related protein
METNIILWSTHCPRCKVLESKLKQKNIDYEECDDVQLMLSKGLETAPALEVDGTMMNFKEAAEWIKEQ